MNVDSADIASRPRYKAKPAWQRTPGAKSLEIDTGVRVQLSPEPQWLDLGRFVRLLLLPLTTALMVATRSDPAVQALEADASNDTRAAVFAAALTRRAVVDWEGVWTCTGFVPVF